MTGWNQPPSNDPHQHLPPQQPQQPQWGSPPPRRFGPIPPQAKTARVAGYVGMAYAALGLLLGVFGILATFVLASGAGDRMGGEDWAGMGMIGGGAFLLIVVSVPFAWCAYRLAQYPTFGMAVATGVIAVTPPVILMLWGFAQAGASAVFGLVWVLVGGVPAILCWALEPARHFLLTQRPVGARWPGRQSPPSPPVMPGQPTGQWGAPAHQPQQPAPSRPQPPVGPTSPLDNPPQV